jgi:hypothetical protein
MPTRRLVTFGDSFTYGHYLPDCDTQSWPALLAAKMDLEILNMADPGASNIEILTKILSFEFKENDLVVVGWTFIERDMIFKEKFDPNGQLERMKARFVAGGNKQDKESIFKIFGDTSSPTISITSLFTILVIAHREHRKIATIDIGNAYLNAPVGDTEILVEIDPMISSILTQLNHEYEPFLDQNGKLLVKLNKALYGTVEAARLWFNTLTKFLNKHGFKSNSLDPCVLNKTVDGIQITIGLFVDDILITSINDNFINQLIRLLTKEYKELESEETKNKIIQAFTLL